MTGLERLFFYALHRLQGIIVLLSRFVRRLSLILLRLWLIVMQMHRISRPLRAVAADGIWKAHCLLPPNDGLLPPNNSLLPPNDSLLGPNEKEAVHCKKQNKR